MATNVQDLGGDVITVTNFDEDISLDCASSSNNELGDVLGTVIRALQRQGILKGTVAA